MSVVGISSDLDGIISICHPSPMSCLCYLIEMSRLERSNRNGQMENRSPCLVGNGGAWCCRRSVVASVGLSR
jgi:hypothetical protein